MTYDNKMNALVRKIEKALTNVTYRLYMSDGRKRVLDAMNYSLNAGGKRLRPVLLLEFCRICGGLQEDAISSACAIEMIHTYSLIHDDLPAMDDDSLRRGKPSCHVAFGEATAILAGDALATFPYELIARDERLSAEKRIHLVAMLASAAGVTGMIGGQMLDILNENRTNVSREELLMMYSGKTAALLRCACEMGCEIAGAPAELCEAAREYADRIGLAFQIIDDILDIEGNADIIGKTVGSDANNNKQTYVELFGLENAKQQAERLTAEALAIATEFPDGGFLTEITNRLLIRRS